MANSLVEVPTKDFFVFYQVKNTLKTIAKRQITQMLK